MKIFRKKSKEQCKIESISGIDNIKKYRIQTFSFTNSYSVLNIYQINAYMYVYNHSLMANYYAYT